MVTLMAVVRVLPGFGSARRWRALQSLFGGWARVLLRLLRVDLDVRGTPPARPGLLICNHLGYLDIVVLAATLRATFVSKHEVASWPLLGFVVTLLGTIYVDRSRRRDVARVNGLIEDSLAAGRTVIVFAEGTSSNGDDVLPLRPSLLASAEHGQHPVSYARLTYRTPDGAPGAGHAVCWWGDAPFLPHLAGLLRLPGVSALLHFGQEIAAPSDRKALALELREAIRALPTTTT